ncbi:prefoldin 2 [Calliopsis andreniformis]|uniref:prefoldin 2 n=1 Tax=Calliopsis andreniformis TaxID=337506 RepID=UPI003FCCFD65
MDSDKKSGKSSKGAKLNAEILSEFQALRNEQRSMTIKLSEMETELKEHKIVIDTLKEIKDPQRKCYRLIGGVLCERTVKDVMPELVECEQMLTKVIENLNEQLSKKGIEINAFKEKHNIIVGEQHGLYRQTGEDKEAKAKRGTC